MRLDKETAKAIGDAVRTVREHKGLALNALSTNEPEPAPIHEMKVIRVEAGEPAMYSKEVLETVMAALGFDNAPALLKEAEWIRRWNPITAQSDQLHAELVGEAVRVVRQYQGLPQSAMGIDRMSVSSIENGGNERHVSKDALATVLSTLGFSDEPALLREAELIKHAELIGQTIYMLRKQQKPSQAALGVDGMTLLAIEKGRIEGYSEKALTRVRTALGFKNMAELLKAAEQVVRSERIGSAVRTVRKQQKLSQDELGVSSSTASSIEKGLTRGNGSQSLATVMATLGFKDVPALLREAEKIASEAAEEKSHAQKYVTKRRNGLDKERGAH